MDMGKFWIRVRGSHDLALMIRLTLHRFLEIAQKVSSFHSNATMFVSSPSIKTEIIISTINEAIKNSFVLAAVAEPADISSEIKTWALWT